MFRGYGANALLFTGFPVDIEWKRVNLDRSDIAAAKYAKHQFWTDLSCGSRRPADAASNIIQGRVTNDPSNTISHLLAVATALRNKAGFPASILVALNEASELVIMEGHARFTAFALEPTSVPNKVEAIVGFSPNIRQWVFF